MRAHRLRAGAFVAAAGLVALIATTGSSSKGHGNPHATTTTTSSTTTLIVSTLPVAPPSSDMLAATYGFPNRNAALSDEFDTLDTTRWGAKTFTSSGSAAYWNGYADCTVHDGLLDIAAVRDPNTAGRWDTCWLSGLHAYSGPRFVDVRAKVPAGNGPWPAPGWEWAAPYGAPPGPELDVAEQLGREPTTYHVTLHYWDATGDHQLSYAVNTGVNLADAFHDYSEAIYPDRVEFLFDGTVVHTVTKADWPSTWTFDTASVVTNIDLDMGSSWAGPVDPTLPSPVHELVDYERVYQP